MVNEEKRKFLRYLLAAFAVVLAYLLFGKANVSEPFASEEAVRVEGDTLVVG